MMELRVVLFALYETVDCWRSDEEHRRPISPEVVVMGIPGPGATAFTVAGCVFLLRNYAVVHHATNAEG